MLFDRFRSFTIVKRSVGLLNRQGYFTFLMYLHGMKLIFDPSFTSWPLPASHLEAIKYSLTQRSGDFAEMAYFRFTRIRKHKSVTKGLRGQNWKEFLLWQNSFAINMGNLNWPVPKLKIYSTTGKSSLVSSSQCTQWIKGRRKHEDKYSGR